MEMKLLWFINEKMTLGRELWALNGKEMTLGRELNAVNGKKMTSGHK